MRRGPTAALAVLALALTPAPSSAADICWDALAPSTGGSWATGANWAGGVAPGAGDTAVLDTTSATCSAPASVTVDADTTVGRIRQGAGSAGGTSLLVDADVLTLSGTASLAQVLGDVQLTNAATLAIGAGANVFAGGTITLGAAATLQVSGALRAVTDHVAVVEPGGGGRVNVAASGEILLHAGSAASLAGQIVNAGTIRASDEPAPGAPGTNLGSSLTLSTASAPTASGGTIAVDAKSTATIAPVEGTELQLAAGGKLIGDGSLTISSSPGPGGAGALAVPASATLDVGTLVLGPGSELELAGAGSANTLVTPAGDGRRSGAGTLTAGAAQLRGGELLDGITKVTGAAEIIGGTTTPAVHDGATLQTQGATAWSTGAVTLGGSPLPGNEGETAAWQNAGTLTIAGAPALKAAGGNGVLSNLSGATLRRDAPAGAATAAARIENAGTVQVLVGSLGAAAALPADAADLDQSGGLTQVAAGASLGMDVRLLGGTLAGAGTVRTLRNSAGLVAPGASPGTLSVEGDFAQEAGGTLQVEIAGALIGQFDRLLAGEVAALGGTLAIAGDPGFAPQSGATFRIVEAKARSGAFAQVTGAQAGGSSYLAQNLTDGAQLCFGCGPPGTVALTVALSGGGAGSVTSAPEGISCGADCAHDMAIGEQVTLTARPAPGSVFAGWSGLCAGLGPCVVTMSEAREITATFAPEPEVPAAPAPATARPGTPAPVAGTTRTPQSQVAGIVAFPSSTLCLASPTLRLRVKLPSGVSATLARVTIAGRGTTTLRGARITQTTTLRRLPRGRRFKVQVAVTLKDGRVVRQSRTYRVCAAKRR